MKNESSDISTGVLDLLGGTVMTVSGAIPAAVGLGMTSVGLGAVGTVASKVANSGAYQKYK